MINDVTSNFPMILINSYSCQNFKCQSKINTKKDLIITSNIFPVCSSKCDWFVVRRQVSKVPNHVLKEYFEEKEMPDTRTKGVDLITDKITKGGKILVSSVSSLSSFELNELHSLNTKLQKNSLIDIT